MRPYIIVAKLIFSVFVINSALCIFSKRLQIISSEILIIFIVLNLWIDSDYSRRSKIEISFFALKWPLFVKFVFVFTFPWRNWHEFSYRIIITCMECCSFVTPTDGTVILVYILCGFWTDFDSSRWCQIVISFIS